MMAMSYGYVYVARIAMGANKLQTIRAFQEAESYPGPSIVIAYSHCIAHGIDMMRGMDQQKAAVESGVWTMFRYDPRLKEQGKNPLTFDSKDPKIDVRDYMYKEIRFRALTQFKPEDAEDYLSQQKKHSRERFEMYRQLAGQNDD
jgi:pyruvate-ferredoxin/flavodoxin oxidoreductase